MTVDASHQAWVRPTLRVHLALSVGMIVTGGILTAAGLLGGRAVPQAAHASAGPAAVAHHLTIPLSERLTSALDARLAPPPAAKPQQKSKSRPHPKSVPTDSAGAPPKTPPHVTPPPPSPAPAPPAARPPLRIHPPKR